MHKELMNPHRNQPLDQIYSEVHRSERSRGYQRLRKIGAAITTAALTGMFVSNHNSNDSVSEQVEISHHFKPGDDIDNIQDVLKLECPAASEADLQKMQLDVGLDIHATNPANPQVSAGDTITATVPAELCQPVSN